MYAEATIVSLNRFRRYVINWLRGWFSEVFGIFNIRVI